MRLNLKAVAQTRKKLADGSTRTYWYAWRGGPRLEGEPGSKEFLASLAEAMRAEPVATPRQPVLADIIDAFRRSKSTQVAYAHYLKLIESSFIDMPVKALSEKLRVRGIFMDWRDSMADKPRVADYAWSTLARLMSFAMDRGKIPRNPCARGGRLYTARRNEAVWSEDHLRKLFLVSSLEVAAAVMFALWTGQRQGAKPVFRTLPGIIWPLRSPSIRPRA
jgi:hypothetical protein